MENFYPRIKNINKRIAMDLGFLYIYRELERDKEKKELKSFWKEASPTEVLQLPMGEYYYRPYIDFIDLDRIMNGLFIETVLEQLSKFTKLPFYESCAILSDIERYFIVPLSEMDVKIIKAIRTILKEQQSYTNELLSEKLQVRPNYISRRMSYLRNNAYFRVTGTVNFPKIKLHQYVILIQSSPDNGKELSSYFVSPYTRTIRRCPNQRFDYIISLTLPKKTEEDLYKYLINLNSQGKIRNFYCDEVISIANNLNFTYYSYSKRPTILSGNKAGFHMDWFKERVLNMINIRDDSIESPFQHFQFAGQAIDFTKLDLKILSLYRRDLDASVRYLSQKLNLSWDETNEHLTKLRPLLFPMILLFYTGLSQTAILFFEEINSAKLKNLEKILSRIPQVFAYNFRNGGAIFTIDLMTGAHRLNDLICETLPDLTGVQFFLASKTSGIFRSIPYQYYNETKKKWLFPKDFFLFQKID
jgi:hypothetical protein